jgi:hypothetical protein
MGAVNPEEGGYMGFVMASGEALLYASPDVNRTALADNAIRVSQPHATFYQDVDFTSFTFHSWNMTDFQKTQLLEVMENGMANIDGYNWPDLAEAQWGRHGQPVDYGNFAYPNEMPGFGYSASVAYSFGPYDFNNIGDSVKIVVAQVFGSISSPQAWAISQAYVAGEIDNNVGWPDGSADGVNAKLPPHYSNFPELLDGHPNDASNELNRWKDSWIYSGVDSLINNARAAQFAFENNYNVPQAPPAPSLEVNSQANGVKINWSFPSGIAPPGDLAGFNIYRSLNNWYEGAIPSADYYTPRQYHGEWVKIHSTTDINVSEYVDTEANRGFDYYYSITAFDDGTQNGADMHQGVQVSGQVLESNFIQNVTITPATRLKPGASTLDSVIVVPNPFNIALAGTDLQYVGNKINFFNVPAECTIRIFTESGDLVKTIDHLGSGDASWGVLQEEQQATDSQQIVVSGLYIAHIETPGGDSVFRKFVIVR